MLDLNNLSQYRENSRIEAKQALGGLPESLWETYSAFANTDGGVILLGVEELPDKSLRPVDLLDPQWLIDDLWAVLRDPKAVNRCILTDADVTVHKLDEKTVIAITVPPSEHIVYVGGDPYQGTYRRRGEGDHRCARDEVDIMLKLEEAL